MDNNENKSPEYESEPIVKDEAYQVQTCTDERPEITNCADTPNEAIDVSEPMTSQAQTSLQTHENYSYGGQMNTQSSPYQGQYANGGYYYSQQQPPKKKGNRLLFAILCGILSFCLICGCVGIGVIFADNLRGLLSFDYSDPGDDTNDDGGINTSGGNQPNGGVLPVGTSILYSGFDLVQRDTPGQKYPSLSDAYEATKDTVVSITVATADGTSAGSGVIIGRLKDGKGYYNGWEYSAAVRCNF